jgi:hypothetical protein
MKRTVCLLLSLVMLAAAPAASGAPAPHSGSVTAAKAKPKKAKKAKKPRKAKKCKTGYTVVRGTCKRVPRPPAPATGDVPDPACADPANAAVCDAAVDPGEGADPDPRADDPSVLAGGYVNEGRRG